MAPIRRLDSRATSMTIGRNEAQANPAAIEFEEREEPEEIPDRLLDDFDNDDDNPPKRLIMAIDFGTTYSAISYVSLSENQCVDNISSADIRSIENYPDDKNKEERSQMKKQVPTEVMYPLDPQFRSRSNLNHLTNSGANSTDSDDEHGDAMEVDDTGFDISRLVSDSERFKWGYEMHEAWSRPAIHFRRTNKAMSRFKLLLDESDLTKELRKTLGSTLKELSSKKIVKSKVGVIADFLTCLLRHAKGQLQSLDLYDDYQVEIVICVPAIWTQKACRDMQVALLTAMKSAEFKGLDSSCQAIENLFIVAEPEAAAAFILDTDHTIQAGHTFLLLDAGGGTVDASTYTVSQTQPLRLSKEVVEHKGKLCGSSYLNEEFRNMLHGLLQSEKHNLEHGKITLDGIIERIIVEEFEYKTKRRFDIYNRRKGPEFFFCAGLEDSLEKGFRDDFIEVEHNKMKDIFMKRLSEIAELMEDQIRSAKEKGVDVNKVILVGGFAGSPSLQGYLERRLHALSSTLGLNVSFDAQEHNVTAVASGAVLRALNKNNGPERYVKSSYGIRRDETAGSYREHGKAKTFRDPVDGLTYVRTIDWKLKRSDDELLPPVWRCKSFRCVHTFEENEPRFLCQEYLYVSDSATMSHYSINSRLNREAEEVGRIVVDFTFLREQGLITARREKSPFGNYVGKKHYRVAYTMVMRVRGRDLRCYAIYNDTIVKRACINIASAFRAGVE
ncbi:hypothetical protein GGR54DRAFT_643547 [Hypoxylon sp. NC1633]|nr:hypothetical protein GGR54DRAFT_643547 [Hypoxylon sp. NC1633]